MGTSPTMEAGIPVFISVSGVRRSWLAPSGIEARQAAAVNWGG
jgi:hypothetical protein